MKKVRILQEMSAQETLTDEIKTKWFAVTAYIEKLFDKKPDLSTVLFLIGLRELGELPEKKFTKDEKTWLIHIANCRILSYSGYYAQKGFDEKGWPVWENVKTIPSMSIFEQENLIRQHIIEYFEREEIITF